jgi:hypothetical protein
MGWVQVAWQLLSFLLMPIFGSGPAACPSTTITSRLMQTGVIAGAFALGGVVVGGALDWVRAAIAERRAAAGRRDELVAGLATGCIGLLAEVMAFRSLGTRRSRVKQLWFGLMEAGLPGPGVGASAGESTYALMKWLGTGVAKGLRHEAPVDAAETVRRTLLPLRSEIGVMAVRLSMTGDERIQDATARVSDAAGALVEHIDEPDSK